MKFLITLSLLASTVYQGINFVITEESEPIVSVYSFAIRDIDGNNINLKEFKGKKILFVNVASKCGFTPQYAELQKLYETYKDELVIIGLPCNQFGGQEPGTGEEIKSFCQKNYGVEFLITEKIDVKGENQHGLYGWLTSKDLNGKMDSSVKWNFTKYLVNENGGLIDHFPSGVKPMSEKIISLL
ncbi:MAG: glutathione peroxidase [Crocinitomicaceae bacterium]